MTAFVFLVPAFWPLLLLVPVTVWLGARLSAAAHRAAARDLDGRDAATWGRRRWGAWRGACSVGAAAATVAALLQPVWGDGDGEPVGPDIVLCVDASWSMAARDVAPSRLAAAQQEIERLATARPGTRLGLVVWAGDAHAAVPLVADLPSIAVIARTFAAGAVGRGGSDPGAAIDTALATLRGGGAAAGAIVLLGDGEDFVGQGVSAAARARAAGVSVHCLGFGSEAGSKIAVPGDGGETFLRDAAGAEIVTRLERDGFAAIAAAGGGRCLAPAATGALAELVDETIAPSARSLAVRDRTRNPAHRFQWPLLVAVLLWMLRVALPERSR